VIDYMTALERVVDNVVKPDAARVDREGLFPRAGVDALAGAGITGLTVGVDDGGGGGGLADAVRVVERLAEACGSTAMVVLMHYAGTAVISAHGPREVCHQIGLGRHLTTLAFSEVGTRSQFWVSQGTAVATGDQVRLDARKSWVTSAGEADSYVWSSGPLDAGAGPQSLWLVPAGAAGLSQPGGFDGLGLRGNGSAPLTAAGVLVSRTAMLGSDGSGLDVALGVALPWFLILSGAFCVGLMEAVTSEAGAHLATTRLEHLDQTLIQQPVTRADFARMRLVTDTTRALLADAVAAATAGRPDATLRALELKAGGAEAAIEVTDLAMKVGGGAAFRKEVGIERRFRDSRAARVMAPTTDAALDFIGRAVSGLPLLDS
jgi:alkylation response protein AidB-like acyl-CoA dehydrogenase